jgi:hypothetical protein
MHAKILIVFILIRVSFHFIQYVAFAISNKVKPSEVKTSPLHTHMD